MCYGYGVDKESVSIVGMSEREKEREGELRRLEEELPPGMPDPPKFLVELAREKHKLEQIKKSGNQKEIDKHLAITLEAYKKCMAEVDKMHMKAVVELKNLNNRTAVLESKTKQAPSQ